MSFEAIALPGYQARLVDIQAAVAHLRLGQMLAFAIMYAAIAPILLLGFLALTQPAVRLPVICWIPIPAGTDRASSRVHELRSRADLRERIVCSASGSGSV
jgi:hypothetical protein